MNDKSKHILKTITFNVLAIGSIYVVGEDNINENLLTVLVLVVFFINMYFGYKFYKIKHGSR